MDLRIHVTGAVIGFRRASKPKEMWTKNTVFCFSVVELEKKLHREVFVEKYSYVRVLLIDGGAVKKILAHSTRTVSYTHLTLPTICSV